MTDINSADGSAYQFGSREIMVNASQLLNLWVPRTSSAGWIDAKRAAERQAY